MPTLWPYLQTMESDHEFLALVVSLYSVGEALGAIALGTLSSTLTTRQAAVVAVMCGVVGSVSFVGAQALSPANARMAVLVGRILQGVWSGAIQAIQQAYVAAVSPTYEVTLMVVHMSTYACLGFVFGPAIGFAISAIPEFQIPLTPLRFSEVTAAGYFVLVSVIASIILYAFLFDEQGDRHAFQTYLQSENSNSVQNSVSAHDEEAACLLPPKITDDLTTKISTLGALIFCNIAFFIHFYGFAIQETVTTPLVQKLYDWSVRRTNALFTAAGVASLLSFIALESLTKWYRDRSILLASFVIAALGYALLLPIANGLSELRFLMAFLLISMAFPIGRACAIALYTKLLTPSKQGFGQGAILAVGAFARVAGPFFAVEAVPSYGGMVFVFGSAALVFGLCGAATIGLFSKL